MGRYYVEGMDGKGVWTTRITGDDCGFATFEKALKAMTALGKTAEFERTPLRVFSDTGFVFFSTDDTVELDCEICVITNRRVVPRDSCRLHRRK